MVGFLIYALSVKRPHELKHKEDDLYSTNEGEACEESHGTPNSRQLHLKGVLLVLVS